MGHSRHVDGHNDLVDTTVDVDEYNTPRLHPDIGGDRRQIRSPRTLYSAGTPALDERLLSSPPRLETC